jgi:hypothetical protein
MNSIYVVSVYSNFTFELNSEIVHAADFREAFQTANLTKDWVEDMPEFDEDQDEDANLEELKQYMFDNDYAVNIIRIN